MDFRIALRNYLLNIGVDITDKYEVTHAFSDFPNWPQIKNEPEDQFTEPLDLENYEINEITSTGMLMCGGGDWQEPYFIQINLNEDHQLQIARSYPGFKIGMNQKQFEAALSITEIRDIKISDTLKK